MEIYDSEEDMKILYNRWEEWIASKGKEIKVGDGTRKTYHYIMGTWYEKEIPEFHDTNDKSEDEDGFGLFGINLAVRPGSAAQGPDFVGRNGIVFSRLRSECVEVQGHQVWSLGRSCRVALRDST